LLFLADLPLFNRQSTNRTDSLLVLQINQLRPFRKVARSAKINLNRYWGLLSQRYSAKSRATELLEEKYAMEMEQNRINEMLEAQACAISQNSVNSMYEEQYSLGTRSRSSVASSCRYPGCDCGLLMQVPSPTPMAQPQHQRFASISSSTYSRNSIPSSPAQSCSSSMAELYFFNNSPRKLISIEDFESNMNFDVESQYSMIL
jgi:hypothetical protein